MKRLLQLCCVLVIVPFWAEAQSSIEFQPGTTIGVQSGADICADSIAINGTFTGSGTKCGGPLPVELAAMSATANARSVALQWETVTEVNSFGFEVERKQLSATNEAGWQTIGFVKAMGAASSQKEYSFTDENVSPGRYSYRLKHIDDNGTFSYSAPTNIEVALPKKFALDQNFPNPFNPSTVITYDVPKTATVHIAVYDLLGRDVAELINGQEAPGRYHVEWNAEKMSSGIYYARMESQGYVSTRKLLLMK